MRAETFPGVVDAYASKDSGPGGDEVLDPCGCQVSGDYRHSQGVAVPRSLRGSAAIDWLANRTPLTVTTWDDPVVRQRCSHAARPRHDRGPDTVPP